jgi:hypothetical protein
VPELIALLADPEVEVARQSLHALGCIGADPKRTVPALVLPSRTGVSPQSIRERKSSRTLPRHPSLWQGRRTAAHRRPQGSGFPWERAAHPRPPRSRREGGPAESQLLKDERARCRPWQRGQRAHDPSDEAGLPVLLACSGRTRPRGRGCMKRSRRTVHGRGRRPPPC